MNRKQTKKLKKKIIQMLLQNFSRYTIEQNIKAIIETNHLTWNRSLTLERWIYFVIYRYLKNSYCILCNNDLNINHYRVVGQQLYCERCFHDNFFVCNDCRGTFNIDYRFEDPSGNYYYCDDCYNENFERCVSCEGIFNREDINEDGYCYNCNSENSVISGYLTRPRLVFNKLPYENTTFLGVELEVEPPKDEDDNCNITDYAENFQMFLSSNGLEDHFILKDDGSIQGFEIVSSPFTLKFAHQKLKFYKMLKYLRNNEYTSHNNGRCGMHIHIGKNCLTPLDIKKLRIIFSKCQVELYKLSNRRGKNTSYCQYEAFNLKAILRGYNQEGRYHALNLNTSATYPKNTIEFRIFRGTLKYSRFIANLQFCDAIIDFVKCIGINFLILNPTNVIWNTFIKHSKLKNRYNSLLKHLKRENLLCV